jgi:lipopolysaccharide/colanic/teichoic acid biosynthesis glycosyltransferase
MSLPAWAALTFPNPAMNSTLKERRHINRAIVNGVGAAIACILLLPLFGVVALLIACTDGWPIFFTQLRIGRNGRPFRIWKFRTMVPSATGAAVTVGGDPRVTRVGSLLRRYKLDELPQLINVLRGEMSLIGPRPEVPDYVDYNTQLWRAILSVRPGLTDPAALAYRNEEDLLRSSASPLTFYQENILPKKLLLSLKYLRSRSSRTDVALILATVRCGFFGRTLTSTSLERLFSGEVTYR